MHHHHIFRKIGTAYTLSKSNMVAYQGGVHTVCVGIVITLLLEIILDLPFGFPINNIISQLCVTNITASIHLNSGENKRAIGRPKVN